MQGNWSAGPGGSARPGGVPEGEEAGSGSGYGGAELAEGGAMLSAIWETEGLQTVGIVVLVFASIKLLHLLGLISFSEGKTRMERRAETRGNRTQKWRNHKEKQKMSLSLTHQRASCTSRVFQRKSMQQKSNSSLAARTPLNTMFPFGNMTR